MNQKLKTLIQENKKGVIIFVVVFVVVSFLFYWYEYRPSQARKECYQRLEEKSDKIHTTESANFLLKACLMKNGVE